MATYTNKNGTNEADTLTYNKAGTYYAYSGKDIITINGGSGVIVHAGAGNNTIKVTGGSGHMVKSAYTEAEGEKIASADKLTIDGADMVEAILGSGKDEIILNTTNGRKSDGSLSKIKGGSWTDTFTVNSGAQKYQLYGEAGNDVFNITGGSNIVCWGGAANDTFNITGGTSNKIYGGDSADVFNLSAASQNIILGYGNDIVNVTAGNSQQIKANLGINTINLKAGSDHIISADIDQTASKKAGKDVGYGQDKVYISGTATGVTANLGDGKDVVELSSGNNHKIYTEGWGDTVIVSGSTADSYIETGDGEDTLTITGGTNITAYTGAASDLIEVSGGSGHNIYTDDDNTAQTSDTLIISGTTKDSHFFTLGGNDIVTVKGNATENISLLTGAHSDSITIEGGKKIKLYCDTGDDEVNVLGGNNLSIQGEAGNDRITVLDTNGRVTDSTFHLGSGNDNISLKNTSNCIINAATGKNSVNLMGDNKATGNTIIAGGDNSHVEIIGCYNTTVQSYGNDQSEIYLDSYQGDTSQTTCTMKLADAANFIQILRPLKDSTITSGIYNDVVYLNYSLEAYTPMESFTLTNVSLDLGKGDNVLKANNVYGGSFTFGEGSSTVGLNGCNDGSLSFGNGANTITLTKCYDLNVTCSSTSPATLSAYGDTITSIDSSLLSLKTGDGVDYIYLKSEDNSGNSFNLVDAGHGEDHIQKYYGDKNYIYGGDSADTITVTSNYTMTVSGKKTTLHSEYDKISGGSGKDDIRVNYSDKVYICGGSDDDKLVLNESKYFCIKGGLGNDKITLRNTEKGIAYGGSGNDEFILSEASLKKENGVLTPAPLESYNSNYITLVGGAGDDKYNYWVNGNVYIDNKTGHTSSDKDTIEIGVTNSQGTFSGDLWAEFATKYNFYYYADSDSVIIRNQADSTSLCISGFSLISSISIYSGTSKSSSELLSWAQSITTATANGSAFYQDMNKRGLHFSSSTEKYITSESAINFDASDSTLAAFKAYDSDLKISGNF